MRGIPALVLLLVIALAGAASPAAAGVDGDLVLASVTPDGEVGVLGAGWDGVSLSADGGRVAFASLSDDLHPDDTDRSSDVYVADLASGALLLVASPTVTGPGTSGYPSLSADGTTVAFASRGLGDDGRGWAVLLADLATGESALVPVPADLPPNGGVLLSGDGRSVAWVSGTTSSETEPVVSTMQAYVLDLDTGVVQVASTTAAGQPAQARYAGVGGLALSHDGSVVAFTTDAANLDPDDTDERVDVYVKDLRSGGLTLASRGAAGAVGGRAPSLSGDGTTIAFESASSELAGPLPAEAAGVFVRDLGSGATTLASAAEDGSPADRNSTNATLSADGRVVAFASSASNLGPPDGGVIFYRSYAKHLPSGALEVTSATADGTLADQSAWTRPAVSATGERVAVVTNATNLDPRDTNGYLDVYVKSLAWPGGSDATPPHVTLTAAPAVVAADRRRPVTVTLSGDAGDVESGVTEVRFAVEDEDGRWQPDLDPVAGGLPEVSWTRALRLPAPQRDDLDGRTFVVRATATNGEGLRTTATATVTVLPHGAPVLRPTELGTLGGGSSRAVAVNARGDVAGAGRTADGEEHAFLWRDGTMIDLGTLGGRSSTAVALNDLGHVVGRAETATPGEHHAFLWRDGTMHDLGALRGGSSAATDVNDRDEVVGSATTVDGRVHAVVWDAEGLRDLGTLGGDYSTAFAINESGQIAGVASRSQGGTRAVRWERGEIVDLGTLGEYSIGTGINARGQVIGSSGTTSAGPGRAFLADGRTFTDLGTLGGAGSAPTDVDDRGRVVGYAAAATGSYRAFVSEDGAMRDLGTLGGQGPTVASIANAINRHGLVVGSSFTPSGPAHAVAWRDGAMTDLGTLDAVGSSSAVDVNDAGIAVGTATRDLIPRAVMWRLGR